MVSRVVLSLYGGGRSRVQTRGLPTMFCIPIMNQTNGDTWHPCIGPRVSSLFACKWTRVNFPLVNNQPIKERHFIMMVWPSTWPYGLYGQVQSAPQFFTCLTWRSNRDISSIRTPFAKINIPPESGKRDGRNGIVFVSIRAL